MVWAKAPAELVDVFEAVKPVPPADARKMFGYPCCFLAGHMFMGLYQDTMVLRLSEEDRAQLLAVEGARVFEPMAGRPMREYVVVPPSVIQDLASLRPWIDRALGFVSALPPKLQDGGRVPSRRAPARNATKAATAAAGKARKATGAGKAAGGAKKTAGAGKAAGGAKKAAGGAKKAAGGVKKAASAKEVPSASKAAGRTKVARAAAARPATGKKPKRAPTSRSKRP